MSRISHLRFVGRAKPVPGFRDAGLNLNRAETDARFLESLRQHCTKLAPLFKPSREKAAWSSLLEETSQRENTESL